ncbi:hypothetical protein ABMY26_07330 (plasmid) [Azospirillum sp. HJ39]|uniref:hypothetical protein n=1 Tax=Azospirillum sp. HJ39 TaxID=3159496 RepID=UPI003556DDA0
MQSLAEIRHRLRLALNAPAFWDRSRLWEVWRQAAPASHVVVAAAAIGAAGSVAAALLAVQDMAKDVQDWRRAAVAADVPLPVVQRRPPDPKQISDVVAALSAAYPDVMVKPSGAELTVAVGNAEKLAAFRAAVQRLQVLDPSIRWQVSMLCAGKECPNLAQMTAQGTVVEFQIEKGKKGR